jgi:hypothetical protein
MHVETITIEQVLQRVAGVQDAQALADLSQASSQETTNHCIALARRYFELG